MDAWSLGWNLTPFTCTYVSSTSFSCSGDKTSIFQDGSRLKIVHGGGTTYHNVQSSTYSSVTIVVVDGTITTPISQVYHALFITGASGSFPTTHHLTYLDAVDSNGLSIRDDGHNLGIFIEDGGNVGIKTSPNNELTVSGDVDITGLTASKPIFTNASKKLVSTGTTPVDQGGTGLTTASGLAALVGSLLFPVGSIYTSISSTNPGTSLGFGTWSTFGSGRTLVGLDAGQAEFDTVEETGGAKTHALSIAELAVHNHTVPLEASGGGGVAGTWVSTNGDDTSVTSSSTGSGTAHNNLQPYIVVYMWKRTA